MKKFRIAVIPGDGIGKEVVPEGMRVLEVVGEKHGINFQWDEFPWSCETYLKTGRMMPEDGLATIRNHDAIFLGAVGFPGVPDHVSLWGLLIPIRRQFQQYANVRPVRLMPGIPCPLAGRKAGEIDMVVVRENNEGEYSSIGGRLHEGTEHEMAMQESVFTRRGVDRILKYAFEIAKGRPKKHVTSATKSNGIAITTLPLAPMLLAMGEAHLSFWIQFLPTLIYFPVLFWMLQAWGLSGAGYAYIVYHALRVVLQYGFAKHLWKKTPRNTPPSQDLTVVEEDGA